ncbi:MAG: FecR family protein [Polaromonas sp.]|uniref:FecR family protein n=1 Tax=Polaromonas sp. TaxID=1869339 RepID=UPI00271B9B6F|nr:FecR family protein [Polaromonas sp.]MDO9115803.1 FecR family protein [Polaromonas sp.]MDP1884962.1 FecR family protein [Polaromonas sp.]
MKQHLPLKSAALLMALAAAWPLQAHALAGIAQFTAGEVNVRQTDGKTFALAKGGSIDGGHAIVTGGDGLAQVRFTDGGLVSLQPNTEFRIASYVDQNNPKEDRFLVDLLRGSMRAITGLIGKRNRDNYRLTTTTATIGIRGSGFKVGYNPDGSLGITSELDKIEVCNQSGCIGLVAGESVKVLDNVTPPVRTSEQPKIETPDTRKDPVVAGDKVDQAGKAKVVTEKAETATTKTTTKTTTTTTTTTSTTTPPVERTFTDIQVAAVGVNSGSPYTLLTSTGATTVFSDNKLLKLQDTSANTPKWSEAGTAQPVTSFKSVGNVSDANFIGWGMWTTGQKEDPSVLSLDNVHYVAGRPTSQTELSSLFYTGVANYTLVGNTAPTQNGVAGTLNSATFSVNFVTGYTISVAINTSFGNFTDSASGSTPSFSGTYIKGMFVGTNAAYAGLTYAKNPGAGMITGAVVFKK